MCWEHRAIITNSPEILKGHILQKGWMSQNKASPLFLVNFSIMFSISFLKGLKKPKTMIYMV